MSIKNGTWVSTICDQPCQSKLQAQAPHCSLIWETLSIAFEGKEERHFPRQFSQIKDSFQPTGTSFITIEGKYLWLFPTNGPSKTISHLQETWQVTVAAKLRSATSWGSLQFSDQKYTFLLCVCCIFQDSSSCSLQSSDHLEVQLDQNVICRVSFCRFCSNSLPSYVMLMVMVCVCFVRWWKLTWTKFWAKICFNVCRRSWESFSFSLLLNLFLIKSLI